MTDTQPESAKDRRRQWYVGIGLTIGLLSLLANLVLGIVIVKVLDEHSDTLTSVQTLETQVAKVIDGLPAADKQLTTFAGQLLEVEQWAIKCLSENVGCQSPPTLTTSP